MAMTNSYLLSLDNVKPRKFYICSQCGHKSLSRYRNNNTMELLPIEYGKCNREIQCRYHLNPYKDGYYRDIVLKDSSNKNFVFSSSHSSLASLSHKKTTIVTEVKPNTRVNIPYNVFSETLKNYSNNIFINRLTEYYGNDIVSEQIRTFQLGTSDRWPGATTFPFINIRGEVVSVQIKLFDNSLHTAKRITNDGEKKSCTDSLASSIEYDLKRNNQPLPEWLIDYKKNDISITCFFGENQLSKDENRDLPIALCEAPKTAIVCNIFFNSITSGKKFLWLATGALGYLTAEKCSVLKGRKVILYPDLGAYEKWLTKVKEYRLLIPDVDFYVSDLLERKAKEFARVNSINLDLLQKEGFDLADFILNETEKQITVTEDERAMIVFDAWIKDNPNGGIFECSEGRLMVKPRNATMC